MKPLSVDLQDEETLRDLGNASVQVVHDLKNQLNGLKLYATFLRKRLEKAERPADEVETVDKLLAGLERAASDMNVLVRLGRPLELRRQPSADLRQMLAQAAGDETLEAEPGAYLGDFDAPLLAEALKGINEGLQGGADATTRVRLRRDETGGDPAAVVEWRGVTGPSDGSDIFKSFAGQKGLRLALAARVIRAHGGQVSHEGDTVRARLPLNK
jgi:signal transduction histidine kinase